MGLSRDDQRKGLMRRRCLLPRRVSGEAEFPEIFDLPGWRDRPEDVGRIERPETLGVCQILQVDTDAGTTVLAFDFRSAAGPWLDGRAHQINRSAIVIRIGNSQRGALDHDNLNGSRLDHSLRKNRCGHTADGHL